MSEHGTSFLIHELVAGQTFISKTDKEEHMAQPPTRGSNYTVQPGDTLWAIAQRAYNDPEDWDTIYQANKQVIGSNPNLIYPGQVLHIPSNPDPGKTPVPPPAPTPPPVPTPYTTPPPTLVPPTYTTPVPPPPTPVPTDNDGLLGTIEDAIEGAVKKELGERKED